MRIQHNIMAMNANRNLTMNNSKLSKNLEKLSSGYRINRAGDDAAGLAISEKMRADVAIYGQSIKNANDGISMIQTAEGALTEVHDMLNRAVSLATQMANGSYDEANYAQVQNEITELNTEIQRIGNDTKFNGKALFIGAEETSFCVGEGDDIVIDFSQFDLSQITIADLSDQDAAKAAITELKDTMIKNVSDWRAQMGAVQNRLEHTVNNLGVTQENIQNAESQIRDTNIAEEMMAYTKNNILIQSAQAMLAQANQVPQGVLQLMQ